MKQVKITAALLLVGLWSVGQTVTPNPGPYQNISTKYQHTWQKWSGGLWNLGKLIQQDSAYFTGITYVPTALDADSNTRAANTAWVRKWVADNVSPGIPGLQVSSWATSGNYTPSDPTPYRLGFKDSMPLKFITNNQIRLIIPDNGVKRNYGLANKFLVIDTATKELYYMDGGSGGSTVTSYGKNATLDSTILLLSDGTRYAAKDSVGSGGGGGSDTLKVSVSDTAAMLAPYLNKNTNRAAYTLFGRGSGSGAPSFLASIDSNWVTGLHSEAYYNTKYAGLGLNYWSPNGNTLGSSGTQFLGTLDSAALRMRVKNTEYFVLDSTGSGRFTGDNMFFAIDAAANRIGFTKKFGSTGKWTYGSGTTLAFSQSNAANISPLNTFTDRLLINSNGTVSIIGGTAGAATVAPLNIGENNNINTLDLRMGIWLNGISNTRSLTPNLSRMAFSVTDGTALGYVQPLVLHGSNSVGVGSLTEASASSILSVTSTTKGVLMPRMTTTQKNAIASPATGLQLYDTDLKQPQYYDGVSWKANVGMIFGTAAPALTPAAVGNFFLDTTNKKLYVSTGTASSADWIILN